MPTALETAIDALSDPDVAAADALRRLLVVSRRIGADGLTEWLRGELSGFAVGDVVPAYRTGSHLPIKLRFDGPMGSADTMTLSPRELPPELTDGMERLAFREPVAELEALSQGERDPEMPLPMQWVALYRHFVEQGSVPHIEWMILNKASIGMPSTHLKGILDRVKSTALDLALSLEDVSSEVGTAGGPTVATDSRLAQQITLHLTQIYSGDNATIAAGDSATANRIEVGDISAVLTAAHEIT